MLKWEKCLTQKSNFSVDKFPADKWPLWEFLVLNVWGLLLFLFIFQRAARTVWAHSHPTPPGNRFPPQALPSCTSSWSSWSWTCHGRHRSGWWARPRSTTGFLAVHRPATRTCEGLQGEEGFWSKLGHPLILYVLIKSNKHHFKQTNKQTKSSKFFYLCPWEDQNPHNQTWRSQRTRHSPSCSPPENGATPFIKNKAKSKDQADIGCRCHQDHWAPITGPAKY